MLLFSAEDNPTGMASVQESESGDGGDGSPTSWGEVTEAVKHLLGGRAPEWIRFALSS